MKRRTLIGGANLIASLVLLALAVALVRLGLDRRVLERRAEPAGQHQAQRHFEADARESAFHVVGVGILLAIAGLVLQHVARAQEVRLAP